MSRWRCAIPAEFMRLSGAAMPVHWGPTAVTFGLGLGWGFFFTPDDYQQGATMKIVFLHVPAALMAINAWLMMLVASLTRSSAATRSPPSPPAPRPRSAPR